MKTLMLSLYIVICLANVDCLDEFMIDEGFERRKFYMCLDEEIRDIRHGNQVIVESTNTGIKIKHVDDLINEDMDTKGYHYFPYVYEVVYSIRKGGCIHSLMKNKENNNFMRLAIVSVFRDGVFEEEISFSRLVDFEQKKEHYLQNYCMIRAKGDAQEHPIYILGDNELTMAKLKTAIESLIIDLHFYKIKDSICALFCEIIENMALPVSLTQKTVFQFNMSRLKKALGDFLHVMYFILVEKASLVISNDFESQYMISKEEKVDRSRFKRDVRNILYSKVKEMKKQLENIRFAVTYENAFKNVKNITRTIFKIYLDLASIPRLYSKLFEDDIQESQRMKNDQIIIKDHIMFFHNLVNYIQARISAKKLFFKHQVYNSLNEIEYDKSKKITFDINVNVQLFAFKIYLQRYIDNRTMNNLMYLMKEEVFPKHLTAKNLKNSLIIVKSQVDRLYNHLTKHRSLNAPCYELIKEADLTKEILNESKYEIDSYLEANSTLKDISVFDIMINIQLKYNETSTEINARHFNQSV